jgi:hypothetical protein
VSGAQPPFEVTGHIRRLEEIDDPQQWSAAIGLDLTVSRAGAVLLQKSYAETEPAEKRNPEAVAAALSRALGRILDQMLRELSTATASPRTASSPPTRAAEPATKPPRTRRNEAR